MSLFSLYRVELRRLALSKYTWIVAALSLCAPFFGYSLLQQSDPSTMNGRYIANPVLAGAIIGAVLWAILTVLECDRIHRAKADVLVDAISSPVLLSLSRVFALLTLSAATTVVCALAYLPYSVSKVDYLFDGGLYAASFLILLLPTWWMSILLAGALYQMTRRIEFTGLLYAGCVYLSFSTYASNDYFMRWLNPLVMEYSDGFTNAPYLRVALYTRALWVLLFGGLFAFSLLCIRRYQKNLMGSLFRGLRKVPILAVSVAMVCLGAYLWVAQPFVDHGPYQFDYTYADESKYSGSTGTTVNKVNYSFQFNTVLGSLKGRADYEISQSYNSDKKECFWLNPGYEVTRISLDGQNLPYETLHNDTNGERQTFFTLPQSQGKTLTVEYAGYPTIARWSPTYISGMVGSDFIQLLNSDCVPSSTSFNLPLGCSIQLILPSELTPIVAHKMLTDYRKNPDGTKTWQRTIDNFLYTWIAACDYRKTSFQAAGVGIDLVYSGKYAENIQKYDIPAATAEVMEYCAKHLGGISFVNKGRLLMLEKDSSGGYAAPGWVEWGETTFTANNLNDPLKGASAAEVFAHEIIHQWWGGLGVECGEEYDNPGVWSDEGLTVYTTYRLMKEEYGALYAKQNYIDRWQAAVDAQDRGFYNRHPEYLQRLPEKYQAQINSANRQTNFYCRMPLMLLKAEQLIGGEEKFDEILQSIQDKYSNNGYDAPFTYQNFLKECGLGEEELNLD